MGEPNVPYVALAEAELRVRPQYPDAFAFVAKWTPTSSRSAIHVEVWSRCERTGKPRADLVAA